MLKFNGSFYQINTLLIKRCNLIIKILNQYLDKDKIDKEKRNVKSTINTLVLIGKKV